MDDLEFEKVFWVLQPQLVRFAAAQLDWASADDVVSSTLLSLVQKSLSYPKDEAGERQLRTFAFRVLVGHIQNEQRSARRRRALSTRLIARQRPDDVVPPLDGDVMEQSRVDGWIAQLPADDQPVILLFNAGFDIRETAEILGCSREAAAKRRARARDRLRSIIEAEGKVP